jgi:flagellar hook-length control protein FliK
MNSSVMVESIMFATAGCESAAVPKASSSVTRGEPKRAFADTPPLAKIREASKSNEIGSSEVSTESEMDHEQAMACQTGPLEESTSPQTAEAPAESEPTEVQSDPVAASTGEMPAGQSDAVALSNQDVVVNVEGVPVEPVIGALDGMPGQSVATDSVVQSDVNAQIAGNAEDSDAGFVSVGADTPNAPASTPVVASEATTLPQGAGGGEMPLSEPDAAIGEVVGGDQAVGSADATAREPVLQSQGSNASVVAQDQAGEAVPVVSDIGEAAQTQSSEQTSGENPNSGDFGDGQLATAGSGTAGQDAVDSPPEEEPAIALGASKAQVEGQEKAVSSSLVEAERGSNTQSELVVNSPSSTESIAEPTSTQANTISSLESGAMKSPVQSVGEQILDSVQASVARGDGRVVIRLDPPELGSVTVRFQEQDGQITAVLEVSKDQTRQEVEQALPQVMRNLQEAGVLVRRLDAVVADQSDGDLDREPLSRDAWGQQEGSEQHNSQAEDSTRGRWSRWAAAQESPLESNEAGQRNLGAGRNRIDMLI